MMYVGELINTRSLGNINRAFLVVGGLVVLGLGALGVSGLLESRKIASMKEEITVKSKAIADAQISAKEEAAKPATEKIPSGLAAIGLFQTKLNTLASTNQCAITQFNASDQMNPFISTFTTGTQANGNWTQVEVKMNLVGPTRSVINTLKGLADTGIPYEFTSLEMSRTQASPTGEATVSANVSIRVLTVPGGA